jgi:hypothetical protein
MLKHVPQPRLCPDCEAIVHAKAEAGPPNDLVIQRCLHNAVFAVGTKQGGTLVHFHVEGPLTDEQANTATVRVLLAAAAAGMKVHEITRQ